MIKKRLLSIILASTFVFSSVNPAYASDFDLVEESESDLILDDEEDISSSEEELFDEPELEVIPYAPEEDNSEPLEDDFNPGYVEPEDPIEYKKTASAEGLIPYQGEDLPAKYLNENIPELKDQSPYGTCWAFAAISLMEINLMKKGIMESPDLSELHLAYFVYNTVEDPLGGTQGDSTNMMPTI